jgi:hypothetical protein
MNRKSFYKFEPEHDSKRTFNSLAVILWQLSHAFNPRLNHPYFESFRIAPFILAQCLVWCILQFGNRVLEYQKIEEWEISEQGRNEVRALCVECAA